MTHSLDHLSRSRVDHELMEMAARREAETAPQMGSELECPVCGTVAINRDFCVCGEYLAWESPAAPTAVLASAPPSYRRPAPPERRDATLLTLHDPASLDEPGAAVSVSVVPGAAVAVRATIRNQSQIVDAFDVRVDGLPDGWWTISPATVFLNPWGTSGDYEQELEVRLHPPRAPEARAGGWPLTVVAHSRTLGADVACAPATLTIEPFHDTALRVGPERRRGRRRAKFDVVVENRGNSPVEVAIAAADTAARCPVKVIPPVATVPIGESVAAVMQVGAPYPLIFARPVDHRLTATHRASGADSAQQPSRVTFQQRPWLPWWLPLALVLLAGLTTVALTREHHAGAPDLEGRTVPNAARLLAKHHLQVGHRTYAPAPPGVAPNTIIGQAPKAGAEMIRTHVDITLAAPPEQRVVPAVKGRTLAAASKALDAAGLAADPQPASAGDDWVVIRQDPAQGSRLGRGKAVTLAAEKPAPAATPAPAPTASPSSRPTATPTPRPTPTATPKPAAPAKRVSATASRQRSATTSARLPADLVFAADGMLYRWASPYAKPARLTSPAYRFQAPTPTADGYVAVQTGKTGRRLVRISADGRTIEPIADGDFSRPSYSPARGLLAVISTSGPGDAGTLWVMAPTGREAPRCAAAPADGQRVGRPAWAPDGRSALVLATGPGGTYDELLTYLPAGDDPAQWAQPTLSYRSARIASAAWIGDHRVAALVAGRAGAPAHLRLLTRRRDGRLERVKDFPALTGSELAATGHHLALRRGDHAIVLLDADHPRMRRVATGDDPAWAR